MKILKNKKVLSLAVAIALMLAAAWLGIDLYAPEGGDSEGIEESFGKNGSAADSETPEEDGSGKEDNTEAEKDEIQAPFLDENGAYYSKDEVSLYIHIYGKLPKNFITKDEAQKLGWSGGSVERYSRGSAIGGDRFYNREGLLPEKEGRVYTECDIDTLGEDGRGGKRIVFSNDGLIYYTGDHYNTFELIYGEE